MSARRALLSGHVSSSSTRRRAISRALAEAFVNRSKNSRFCGVRRSRATGRGCTSRRTSAAPVQSCAALQEGIEQVGHEAVADEDRSLTVRSRGLVYAIAGVLLGAAVVLAAFRVGERAGRLSDWQALALGVTQGASELLPISSSGHLILVPWIANWHYLEENPTFNKTFDVSLHLGTLVAVVVYFWNDVVRYVIAWFRSVRARAIRDSDERLAWAIAIATVPAAIVGALGEDTIDNHLGEPWQIAFFLAFFAVLLWIADRSPQRFRLAMLRLPTAVAV